jgi:hypothetical protein
MKLIERYCKDHDIPYDPDISPCANMAKGDTKKHHDCPMAFELNGKATPMCNYQMNWIGNMEDTFSLSIDELMLIQKVHFLMKEELISDKKMSKKFHEGLVKSMFLFEGISIVLNLIGFELTEDSRITKCSTSKEQVSKDLEEHCKQLEDILKKSDCCFTCKNYKEGICEKTGKTQGELDKCSWFCK